jgi:predicted MFS family arabinose efflux permease
MTEPCLLSVLMSRVAAAEQNGASAMNFVTIAAAGILSALTAGALLSRFGYTVTVTACAVTTAFAAALFYGLFHRGMHQ